MLHYYETVNWMWVFISYTVSRVPSIGFFFNSFSPIHKYFSQLLNLDYFVAWTFMVIMIQVVFGGYYTHRDTQFNYNQLRPKRVYSLFIYVKNLFEWANQYCARRMTSQPVTSTRYYIPLSYIWYVLEKNSCLHLIDFRICFRFFKNAIYYKFNFNKKKLD